MSCTTLYALRTHEGWSFAVEKVGCVDLTSPDAIWQLIRHPVSEFPRHSWLCRGLLIDPTRRVARFHSCSRCQPRVREWERAVQHADAWRGWDIRFAWGGNVELAETAGNEAPAIAAELRALETPEIAPRHCRYDTATHALDYDEEPVHYVGSTDGLGLITVITPEGRSRHHAVSADPGAAAGLLASGPELVTAVGRCPVWPPVEEVTLQGWGMLIDTERQELGFWGIPCTPGQCASLSQRFSGWRFVRLEEGYAEQLAQSGTDPTPWCAGLAGDWPTGGDTPEPSGTRHLPPVRSEVHPCIVRGHAIGWDWLT